MTQRTPEIIICPSCERQQLRKIIITAHIVKTKHYSDGRCISPTLHPYPNFVKCPSCGTLFKINEDVIFGEKQCIERGISVEKFRRQWL